MRIAYLINQYPKVSHSFVRREIHALEQLGVEVQRFTIRKTEPCPDPADQLETAKTDVLLGSFPRLILSALFIATTRPIKLIRTTVDTVSLSRRADRGVLSHIAYLLEACSLVVKMQEQGIRHVHAHFGTNPTLVALLCSRLADVTYSFTVHGPEEFDRPIALKLKQKIQDAAFVVAISSFGKSQLMRWCDHCDWSKLNVVHCVVDEVFLAENLAREQTSAQPVFVCVGRLCEQKGQMLLLQAIAKLKQQGIVAKFVLAGDGEMRPAIEASIRELDVADCVEITGWLTGAEIRQWLLKSTAMVLPSFAEGLPVVIMESLALGTPVITTYVAGIPELVEDGVCGWLVPAGSVDRLVEALLAACKAPELQLRQLGHNGAAKVRLRHDPLTEARKLKQLFEAESFAEERNKDPLSHDVA